MNIFENIKKGLQEAIKYENDKLDLEEKLLEAEAHRLNGTKVFSL